MRDELVLWFSNISWDFLWQRHQELACRFAAAGNRVIYIEPIGIRMPKWEDRYRLLARLKNRRAAGTRQLRPVAQNVWAHDPLVIPFQTIPFIHRRNVVSLTRALQGLLVQFQASAPVIWTYVPTPLALDVIRRIPHKLLVYDCVDALTLNPKGVFDTYAAAERELSQQADVVFVTSYALYERQRPLNPYTYRVPNGVAFEKFAIPAPRVPSDLDAIPAPRLGFFGGIDERVDVELLAGLAARHPEWSFVMLGVVRTDVSPLRAQRNVHFLGFKAHDALPAYLHHLDVLLMPYRVNAYSRHMYPAKLHECLAVGKPTVVTALPEFEPFHDVLYVAATPEMYERAICAALREGRAETRIQARRARASENTWEARFQEIQSKVANVV